MKNFEPILKKIIGSGIWFSNLFFFAPGPKKRKQVQDFTNFEPKKQVRKIGSKNQITLLKMVFSTKHTAINMSSNCLYTIQIYICRDIINL